MNQRVETSPPELGRLRGIALIVGLVGAALTALGAFIDARQFFFSYLIGYVLWTGVALGSLGILMVHHVAGGAWSLVIRRILEAATRTIPLMLVLFLPVALGIHQLYEWSHSEAVAASEPLQHKAPYLNVPFFLARVGIYFAIWLLLAHLLNKWSAEQDERAETREIEGRMQRLSGPGLILFFLTVTFAVFDWIMSLDPEWYSTIFGLIMATGWGMSALAFTLAIFVYLRQSEPLRAVVLPAHLHDLGKFLLMFVMLWSYLSFSQFLLMWSANLPEEIPWYLRRMSGGWQYVSLGLVLFQFAFPFLLLLSRDIKRNPRRIVSIALFLLVVRWIDAVWLIAPEAHREEYRSAFHLHWLDLAAPIGIGGLWVAFFAWQLSRRPLLPQHDSLLEKALHPAHH
ncbi:hypothetical protein [Pyrinomonas sp.]|uniref:hypothetical protein n=1 Tax=Pyrinomonas sp. TaxID=2080306 RepID=UPI00331A8064